MTTDSTGTFRGLRRAPARLAALAITVAIVVLAAGASRGVSLASAAPAPEIGRALAQATDPGDPDDPEAEDEDEEEVPIPPNLLDDPADTLRAPGAPADSAAFRPDTLRVVPNVSAEPETLFSVPPGVGQPAAGSKPIPAEPVVEQKRSRGGILGLTPAVIILGLAVLHLFVIRSIN